MYRKLLVVLCIAVMPLTAQERKKRVAVLDFDYATVQSYVSGIFGTRTDVGKGVADMLVNQLVQSGQYSVFERKQLDKILAEQNLSNSDRANPATAARIGQLIGVDAIIMGSITQMGRDDKKTEVGALGRATGRFGVTGIGKKESKAIVQLTARIVNTDTAEILAAAQGQGESTRTGTALLGSGGVTSGSGGGYYDMTSRNFADTILGEATTKAVHALGAQLDSNTGRVTIRTVRLQGTVADYSSGTMIINLGSKAGVKVGDKFEVSRLGREIRDPATDRVIKRITDKLGELVITEVDDLSATGKFTGSGDPKVGDTVKTPDN